MSNLGNGLLPLIDTLDEKLTGANFLSNVFLEMAPLDTTDKRSLRVVIRIRGIWSLLMAILYSPSSVRVMKTSGVT